MKTKFKRAIAIALLPAMTGCTSALWTPACATEAMHPEIAGLVRNFPAQGDQALVVKYHAPLDSTDVDLVVPLDESLSPKPPFALGHEGYVLRQNDSKDWVELAGSVEPQQLATLLRSGDTIAADRPLLAKHLKSADWSPVQGDYLNWPPDLKSKAGSALVMAYRIDLAGQVVPVAIDTAKQPPEKIVLDSSVHVLMVPTVVNRPPGDQTRSKIIAVIFTPPAVITDAAAAVGLGVAITAVGVVAVPVVSVALVANPHIWDSESGATTRPTRQVPLIVHHDE